MNQSRFAGRVTVYVLVGIGMLCVAIAIAARWYFGQDTDFSAQSPPALPSRLEPLEVSASSLTLPIELPVSEIAAVLEQEFPREDRGVDKDAVLGMDLHWDYKRLPLHISGTDRLQLNTQLEGKLRLHDRILGIPFRETAHLQVAVQIDTQPQISTAWRVVPNFRLRTEVPKAQIRFLGLDISLREFTQKHLESMATEKWIPRAEQKIMADDFLERGARRMWPKLCRSRALGSDQRYWLESRVLNAHAAPVRISSKTLQVQLGLDAQLRISTRPTQPQCPFPRELSMREPAPGSLTVILPAEIDYATLSAELEEQVRGRSYGNSVLSLQFDTISMRPHGSALLLQSRIYLQGTISYLRSIQAVLYIHLRPRLEPDTQSIYFSDLRLDTESRSALPAAVGEALEPLLFKVLSELRFALGPDIDKGRRELEEALQELSNEELRISGEVVELGLQRIDVGPEYLRLVAKARADVQARWYLGGEEP